MARRCHMRLATRPLARRRPKGRQPSAKPRRSRPLPGGVFARGDRPMRMKHLQKFYSNNRRHSLVILERAVTRVTVFSERSSLKKEITKLKEDAAAEDVVWDFQERVLRPQGIDADPNRVDFIEQA